MKFSGIIILSFILITSPACKPKKCAAYSDPQKNYKADYDKKGLVKKKNKAPKRNWSQY